jgi:hypothetical protein
VPAEGADFTCWWRALRACLGDGHSRLMLQFSLNNGLVITFGTDSSLAVTEGWDNVMGFGVPNDRNFITAAGK